MSFRVRVGLRAGAKVCKNVPKCKASCMDIYDTEFKVCEARGLKGGGLTCFGKADSKRNKCLAGPA
jgi:hypothetical protein